MKKLITIILGITIGVLTINRFMEPRINVVEKAEKTWLKDEISTSQAAETR